MRGTLQIALDTSSAPLACFRLAALADKKFFDGLTFHRVEPNFVVQGGDPRGDGSGGPGFVMRDELSLAPYAAGSVGIALSGPDTGGSQLFVTLTPRPHLLGRYPHVGTVAAGLDVATRLRVGDRILRARAGEGPLPAYVPVWYGALDPARLDREIPGWHEEAARVPAAGEVARAAALGEAALRARRGDGHLVPRLARADPPPARRCWRRSGRGRRSTRRASSGWTAARPRIRRCTRSGRWSWCPRSS